jgi:hypothetical protein
MQVLRNKVLYPSHQGTHSLLPLIFFWLIQQLIWPVNELSKMMLSKPSNKILIPLRVDAEIDI